MGTPERAPQRARLLWPQPVPRRNEKLLTRMSIWIPGFQYGPPYRTAISTHPLRSQVNARSTVSDRLPHLSAACSFLR
jgi:hypothetical protein